MFDERSRRAAALEVVRDLRRVPRGGRPWDLRLLVADAPHQQRDVAMVAEGDEALWRDDVAQGGPGGVDGVVAARGGLGQVGQELYASGGSSLERMPPLGRAKVRPLPKRAVVELPRLGPPSAAHPLVGHIGEVVASLDAAEHTAATIVVLPLSSCVAPVLPGRKKVSESSKKVTGVLTISLQNLENQGFEGQ